MKQRLYIGTEVKERWTPGGLPSHDLMSLLDWCETYPGHAQFYYGPYTGFWFEDSRDAMVFILTWPDQQ